MFSVANTISSSLFSSPSAIRGVKPGREGPTLAVHAQQQQQLHGHTEQSATVVEDAAAAAQVEVFYEDMIVPEVTVAWQLLLQGMVQGTAASRELRVWQQQQQITLAWQQLLQTQQLQRHHLAPPATDRATAAAVPADTQDKRSR